MEKKYKMPRIERAKQFAPFDALKGLGLALREKEKEHELCVQNQIEHIDIFDS